MFACECPFPFALAYLRILTSFIRMDHPEKTKSFVASVLTSLQEVTFVKLNLSNYKGLEEGLKNIYLKRVMIKNEDKLSFTYRYKTRDIVKNYDIAQGVTMVNEFLNSDFRAATLFTTQFDLFFENQNNQRILIRQKNASFLTVPSLEHDRTKNRPISSNEKPYLTSLKITDNSGKVLASGQDKYKQINHYIEILGALIKEMPTKALLKVADMGSGKGYLTFALYDYLTNVVKLNSEITGVEYREDLVNLCNKIANDTGFKNLSFKQGSIDQFDSTGINILIALHACDTATDDAIAKGIKAGAGLIVVAPCCHKQIRKEVEMHKTTNNLDFLTKHGIFMERQCEMVTDGIRSLILEHFGYKTKVFEFISDAHTPKNVMIIGIKNVNPEKNNQALEKIKAAKAFFGIETHYLEKLMEI